MSKSKKKAGAGALAGAGARVGALVGALVGAEAGSGGKSVLCEYEVSQEEGAGDGSVQWAPELGGRHNSDVWLQGNLLWCFPSRL